jgi:hypothetical protein
MEAYLALVFDGKAPPGGIKQRRSAQLMIIRHDRSDRQSLVDPCKWPAITSFFRGPGAASLIAPTWLLTAAHVARHIPNLDWIRDTCAS